MKEGIQSRASTMAHEGWTLVAIEGRRDAGVGNGVKFQVIEGRSHGGGTSGKRVPSLGIKER